MNIKLLGHCSVLLETKKSKILLDPYFSQHGNLLYRRCQKAASYEVDVQGVDAIVVTHGHWDHAELSFLRKWRGKASLYMPTLSLKRLLLGGKAVHNGQAFEVGDFKITPVPAWHFCSAVGYVIEAEGQTVYFSGDTFYGKFMKAIGQKWDVDVAILNITAYVPPMTMGSNGAYQCIKDLEPEAVIPVHQDIIPTIQPNNMKKVLERLEKRLESNKSKSRLFPLKNGQSFVIYKTRKVAK